MRVSFDGEQCPLGSPWRTELRDRPSPRGDAASPGRVMHGRRRPASCAHRGAGLRAEEGTAGLRVPAGACDSRSVRAALLVIGLLAVLAVAGCGESKTDKAQKQVCSARADISPQVDELKSLTLTTATVSGVRDSVDVIQASLKRIASAQGTLSDNRRAEVKAATDKFVASMTSIAKGLTSDVSLSEARTRL